MARFHYGRFNADSWISLVGSRIKYTTNPAWMRVILIWSSAAQRSCPLPKLLRRSPYCVAEVIPPALTLKVVQWRCPDITLESIYGTPNRRWAITVRLGSQQSNADLQSVSNVAKGVRCWWTMSMLTLFPSTAWSVLRLGRKLFWLSTSNVNLRTTLMY